MKQCILLSLCIFAFSSRSLSLALSHSRGSFPADFSSFLDALIRVSLHFWVRTQRIILYNWSCRQQAVVEITKKSFFGASILLSHLFPLSSARNPFGIHSFSTRSLSYISFLSASPQPRQFWPFLWCFPSAYSFFCSFSRAQCDSSMSLKHFSFGLGNVIPLFRMRFVFVESFSQENGKLFSLFAQASPNR